MATIKLRVSERIYDKVMWLLGQFKSEDLEIIASGSQMEEIRSELQDDLKAADAAGARFFSIEEADEILDSTIRQYEN